MNKKIKILLLTIVLLIIIAINLIVFINHNKPENTKSKDNTTSENINMPEYNVATIEETEQARKEMLNNSTEATRMKTYVGQYISYVDSKNYQEAYNLLYDNFKNTYFPTLGDFESYANQKYPEEIMLEYGNMEREGTIYILSVTIKNPLDSSFQSIEQNFVLQESDLNDYVLSFSVE